MMNTSYIILWEFGMVVYFPNLQNIYHYKVNDGLIWFRKIINTQEPIGSIKDFELSKRAT